MEYDRRVPLIGEGQGRTAQDRVDAASWIMILLVVLFTGGVDAWLAS